MINRYNLYLYTFLAAFWIYSGFGFIAEEFVPPLESVRGAVMALCDFVFIALGLLTLRQRGDVIVFVSFVVLGFLSTIILGHEGIFSFLNGFRDFVGIVLVVPILRWFFTHERADEFGRTMDRQLRIWLWVQAVTITFQFIKYGANDHGGGSMGVGASGLMSLSIYMVSFYLVARNWDADSYFASLWKNRLYIFLLYPTFLNETKVSFLLLAAYFFLLLKFDKKLVVRMLYIIPLSVALLIGLGNLYFTLTNQDAEEVLSEDFFVQYLYGNDLDFQIEVAMMIQDGTMEVDPRDWWTVDIPRFGKMLLIIPELRDTDGGLTFGAGLGQFKGLTYAQPPRFARINAWLLVGSRPWTFMMFVQLGLIGLLWFGVVMVRDLRVKGSLYPMAGRVVTMLAAVVLIIMVYNEALRSINFCVLLFYIALSLKYFIPQPDANADDDTEKYEAEVTTL